jgi:hypothetical protein
MDGPVKGGSEERWKTAVGTLKDLDTFRKKLELQASSLEWRLLRAWIIRCTCKSPTGSAWDPKTRD